jgi:hypothetical protein
VECIGVNSATPVSKEEVRLLAIEYGVREAARKLGLNEDRVRQWSSRHKWFSKPDVQNSVVTTVTKPSVVLMDELADNERETRLSLSRYARRAAKDSESATMREAPYVKAVAQVAGITHKWGDQSSTTNHFTLNTLNINCLEITEGTEDNNQA